MFKPSAAVLMVLLLLPACGQAPKDGSFANAQYGESPKRVITIRNPSQEALLKLNDLDRNLTLRRAVRDDDGSCPRIDGSKYQQDYKGMAMWVAHCSSGDWAVYVAPSGDVQARACKDIPVLNDQNKMRLPACRPWPTDPLAPVAEPHWPETAPLPQPADKL